MKRVLALVAVTGLIGLLSGGPADAFSLAYGGPIKIKMSDFTDSTLYPNGTSCASTAACDAAASSTPVAGVGGEDSWAVFQLTQILSDDGLNTVLWNSSATEQLTGIIYGIQDHDVVIDASGEGHIRSIGIADPDGAGPLQGGIRMDVYLDSTPGITTFNATGGPTARTGQASYPTVTDGTLFLSAELVPGAVAGDFVTLLDESVDQSGSFTGDGTGFANVTGGSHMAMFNSGQQPTNIGTFADLKLVFDVDAAAAASDGFGWTTNSEDPIRAAVPEPGTLVALGLAMVGMVGYAYRRRQ